MEPIAGWLESWQQHPQDFLLLKVQGSDYASTDGCLILDKSEGSIVIIQDEEAAATTRQEMYKAGVIIVPYKSHRHERSVIERMIDTMLVAEKSVEEISAALRAYEIANTQ